MLSEEAKIFEEIKELLSTKVFPKVNATSQEAAEIVVEFIKHNRAFPTMNGGPPSNRCGHHEIATSAGGGFAMAGG